MPILKNFHKLFGVIPIDVESEPGNTI